MGVKDLWSVLSPVCERKSLWELQDKTIAIDLSCWICDSQNVSDSKTQPRMYLRNLFFRANCLLMLGAHPIFVLEGEAPEIKYSTIGKRINVRKKVGSMSQTCPSQKGKRTRLNGLIHKCQQLLTIMGLKCIKSPGEAEAFCAVLNSSKHVDGCITQDGDCFLYGAQTVYRNFTISPSGGSSASNAGFSMDVYEMSVIEDRLSLGRNKLIAISLLCGCDYNEKGVSGIGKETVLKFLDGVKDDDIISRLKRWRTDLYFDNLEEKRLLVSKGVLCDVCGHSGRKAKHLKNGCDQCGELKGCNQNSSFPISNPAIVAELNIRRRALLDPEFPSQLMIDEFLHQDKLPDGFTLDKSWNKPDLRAFILFAQKLLGWTEMYALEKFLPIVTRWQIMQLQQRDYVSSNKNFSFSPQHIVKKRVNRGIECFEVNWLDVEGIVTQIDPNMLAVTVEPKLLFEKAYPLIVEAFVTKNMKGKKGAIKKKGNACINTKKTSLKARENNTDLTKKQSKIDKYLISPSTGTVLKKRCVLEDTTNISNNLNHVYQASNIVKIKQSESSDMRRLSACFAEMILESEDKINKTKKKTVILNSEFEDSILSRSCSHQKTCKIDFEKSLCWDICEICAEDDQIADEDLSLIVESIVNKKNM